VERKASYDGLYYQVNGRLPIPLKGKYATIFRINQYSNGNGISYIGIGIITGNLKN